MHCCSDIKRCVIKAEMKHGIINANELISLLGEVETQKHSEHYNLKNGQKGAAIINTIPFTECRKYHLSLIHI